MLEHAPTAPMTPVAEPQKAELVSVAIPPRLDEETPRG